MDSRDAELVAELTDALADMVNQHCAQHTRDGLFLDSMSLHANADAMRLLARLGKIEIIGEHGKRVLGRWVKP